MRDKWQNLIPSYNHIHVAQTPSFKMTYYMSRLLPYLRSINCFSLWNSLVFHWFSPLVPWRLVAHFVRTGLNCLSFQKYCFRESCCISKLLQWSSPWICKQKSGGLEKSEIWNWRSLIVPLTIMVTIREHILRGENLLCLENQLLPVHQSDILLSPCVHLKMLLLMQSVPPAMKNARFSSLRVRCLFSFHEKIPYSASCMQYVFCTQKLY